MQNQMFLIVEAFPVLKISLLNANIRLHHTKSLAVILFKYQNKLQSIRKCIVICQTGTNILCCFFVFFS